MSVESEDANQVVDRKAEVRPASSANGARPTTKRDAGWVVPQPARIVHQSPRIDWSGTRRDESMEQIRGTAKPRREPEEAPAGAAPGAPAGAQQQTQAIDDLLDSIDEVLEVDAEAFVRSFVQKGGQ